MQSLFQDLIAVAIKAHAKVFMNILLSLDAKQKFKQLKCEI